ncbi:E1B 55K [Simian adenovirus 19]|uniref:E1B 55 kDa protein n=1 Tax=Simian adenovirus 19 TaxID=38416 RepID=A0A0M4MEZ5_9ADEN|nr:E1B 55K [Simian adenovirus 19]ALE30421.1 E1B 55K [Simian adenovirus 19]
MEQRQPPVVGLHAGLHDHGAVAGAPEEEEGLHLLAGAASARSGASGGRGGGEREPEGRRGPSSGIEAVGEPEEGTSDGVRKRRRTETEEVNARDYLTDLTVRLMSRRRPETVAWSELETEFKNGNMNLLYKYSFEQIQTHWLEPWEDWETAFANFAKIALRPDKIYTVRRMVNIRKCVYVLGNGAMVQIQTCDRVAFNCCMQSMGPGVIGMSGVTFANVRFTGENFFGAVFMNNTSLTLHGVYFLNLSNTCVECWGRACLRGCTFYGCWKAVVGRTKSHVSVKKCMFERCVIAIMVEGQGRIRNNVGAENGCFLLLKGSASVKHNMICGTGTCNISHLLTCSDGNCQALRTLHIVSHRRLPWPVLEHNMLTRCSVHVGARRGMLVPYQCNFSYTKVLLETDAFPRVCFNGVFDMTVEVFKVVRYDESKSRCRPCECGANHLRLYPVTLNVTEELRADHLTLSCLRTDYESSDEE